MDTLPSPTTVRLLFVHFALASLHAVNSPRGGLTCTYTSASPPWAVVTTRFIPYSRLKRLRGGKREECYWARIR